MIGQRDGKIENGQASAHQYRTKGFVTVPQPMGDADEDAAAEQPDAYTADGPDPVVVDGVFYEEADRQHQDSDTDLADQVLSNEFFQVRMAFEKARRGRRGRYVNVGRPAFGENVGLGDLRGDGLWRCDGPGYGLIRWFRTGWGDERLCF